MNPDGCWTKSVARLLNPDTCFTTSAASILNPDARPTTSLTRLVNPDARCMASSTHILNLDACFTTAAACLLNPDVRRLISFHSLTRCLLSMTIMVGCQRYTVRSLTATPVRLSLVTDWHTLPFTRRSLTLIRLSVGDNVTHGLTKLYIYIYI